MVVLKLPFQPWSTRSALNGSAPDSPVPDQTFGQGERAHDLKNKAAADQDVLGLRALQEKGFRGGLGLLNSSEPQNV